MDKMNQGYLSSEIHVENALCFVHCGVKPNQRGELCGPMARHMYLLHYVIDGKGTYEVNHQTYHLKAGDVFAIFPDDVVSYRADTEEPWYFCWIGFCGTKADEYYRNIGINYENPVKHLDNSIFADGVMNCMRYIQSNVQNALSELRLASFVLEILSAFEEKNKGKQKNYVKKAITYMEFNYGTKITPADVAAYVNLEYSYFYKLFKKEIGSSPNTYLNNLRMEKAKQFLQADVELKNIPLLVGINDVFYFSKLFKKYEGITPSLYKKMMRSPCQNIFPAKL